MAAFLSKEFEMQIFNLTTEEKIPKDKPAVLLSLTKDECHIFLNLVEKEMLANKRSKKLKQLFQELAENALIF